MNNGIVLWTEVVCANCSMTTVGEFVKHGKRKMRTLKAALKDQGWTIKDGETFCAGCSVVLHFSKPDTTLKDIPDPLELPTPLKGRK